MYSTDEEEIRELSSLVKSKKYFRNQGHGVATYCSRFEASLSQYLGVEHSLLVTSGTNALICALGSCGVGPGDEVIIPSFTFFATAVAVVNAGAVPVIVNIDQFLSIDPAEVQAAITSKTKAIIAVHMDGRACDLHSLRAIADKNKLMLIEDVAQAMGGEYRAKKLGSLGDASGFSFNVDKIISCGEGGAFVTNQARRFEHALCLQDACCSFGPTFKESFRETKAFIGMSMRASEIQGLLMGHQLKKLDPIIARLRERQSIMKNVLPCLSSHDEAGECGTSIYLKFDNIAKAKFVMTCLVQDKILAIPISARPAHFCWQWMPLLNEKFGPQRYQREKYQISMDLLNSVLKLNVPYELGLDETQELSEKIKKIISI